MKNNDDYRDIIDLPHPTSKKHPRMSIETRAAQFSPFAALTGLDSAMDETADIHTKEMNDPGFVSFDDIL